MIRAALILALVLAGEVSAQQYVNRGGQLYERYQESYTYYHCGRRYTGYRWAYRPAQVTHKDKDWRSKGLDLIHATNEAAAYQEFVETITGTRGQQYGQQQQIPYPSAGGSTAGAYTQYYHSRYGTPDTFDANKADERIAVQIDQFTRVSGDNARRADDITAGVGGLIQLNSERVAAAVELQETRAAVAELSRGMRDAFLAQAEILRALKPKDGETTYYEQDTRQPQNGQPPPRPEHPTGLVSRFCGACHGPEIAAPGGSLYLAESISSAEFANSILRMNPQTPWKRGEQPFRMPPEGSPQPTAEQRALLIDELAAMVSD